MSTSIYIRTMNHRPHYCPRRFTTSLYCTVITTCQTVQTTVPSHSLVVHTVITTCQTMQTTVPLHSLVVHTVITTCRTVADHCPLTLPCCTHSHHYMPDHADHCPLTLPCCTHGHHYMPDHADHCPLTLPCCTHSHTTCQTVQTTVPSHSLVVHTVTLHAGPCRPLSPHTPLLYVWLCVCSLQWNLSIKDTLSKGHLSNEDIVCSPNRIELFTNLPRIRDSQLGPDGLLYREVPLYVVGSADRVLIRAVTEVSSLERLERCPL